MQRAPQRTYRFTRRLFSKFRAGLPLGAFFAAVVFAFTVSAEAPEPSLEAQVTLHGATVFTLRSELPDPKLATRASQASRAVEYLHELQPGATSESSEVESEPASV